MVIHEFRLCLKIIAEHVRLGILAAYHYHVPNASDSQQENLFTDQSFRASEITRIRALNLRSSAPLTKQPWPEFEVDFHHYEHLVRDLREAEELCRNATTGKAPVPRVEQKDIAPNGDTILEISDHPHTAVPILRFRVSSHILSNVSVIFAQFLSTIQTGDRLGPDMRHDMTPPHAKQILPDGSTVMVYRMPQRETDHLDSLTILLHAAHMHNEKVPRTVRFEQFISIAEVCLIYRCTSPLEWAVEYRWLPQWLPKLAEDDSDGWLLISYVFGLRGIFERSTKSAIMNTVNERHLWNRPSWPENIKEKILSERAKAFSRIRDCCASILDDYFQTPSVVASYGTGIPWPKLTQLTTPTRCSKASYQCDATNIGWLMMVFNQARILHYVTGKPDFYAKAHFPSRSLAELLDILRKVPSAPTPHPATCDYAPAFRSAMDEIYDSVSGLTLYDVSGRAGWALSKDSERSNTLSDGPQGATKTASISELSAPQDGTAAGGDSGTAADDDAITLRILTHLDDIKDLHAAAMIDKSFYTVYKKHELTIMRNFLKKHTSGVKKRWIEIESSQSNTEQAVGQHLARPTQSDLVIIPNSRPASSYPGNRTFPVPEYQPVFPIPRSLDSEAEDDLYCSSPSQQPTPDERPRATPSLSAQEIERILWLEQLLAQQRRAPATTSSPLLPDRAEVADLAEAAGDQTDELFWEREVLKEIVPVEDKAMMIKAQPYLNDGRSMG